MTIYEEEALKKKRESWVRASEKYRKTHPERIQQYTKKYQKEHPEYPRIWNANNRDKRKGYSDRARSTEKGKLSNSISCLIWHCLKKNKGNRHWPDLVGYTVDQLKRHLEKKFTDGMTWEKFMAGEIHIDHKIPKAAFNFNTPEDIDFERCWALKNLQPMWAKENIQKSDKVDRPFQPSLSIQV